jgi:polyphosphate kinase
LNTLRYEEELRLLQVELVKLQRWVQAEGKRIAILFEGRDAAGKGGTIRRFTEHLNPRAIRVVALPKPTEEEQGQWYFQRYSKQLPNRGEIVFFDRSWYNRAVVEPVNKFCTEAEYHRFLQQVPEFEHMLYEDGLTIIKFWFSISKDEQLSRFDIRRTNPLKQWKLSPIDEKAQQLWQAYTHYKEEMFSKTHTSFSPWIIVKANNKKLARLESIRYVLNTLPYSGKDSAKTRIAPDPNIVTRFHRNIVKLD